MIADCVELFLSLIEPIIPMELKDPADKSWENFFARMMHRNHITPKLLNQKSLHEKTTLKYVNILSEPTQTLAINNTARGLSKIQLLAKAVEEIIGEKGYFEKNAGNYKKMPLKPIKGTFIIPPHIYFAEYVFLMKENISKIEYSLIPMPDNDDLLLYIDFFNPCRVKDINLNLEDSLMPFLTSWSNIQATLKHIKNQNNICSISLRTLVEVDPLFVWLNMHTDFEGGFTSLNETCKLLDIEKPSHKIITSEYMKNWIKNILIPALEANKLVLLSLLAEQVPNELLNF